MVAIQPIRVTLGLCLLACACGRELQPLADLSTPQAPSLTGFAPSAGLVGQTVVRVDGERLTGGARVFFGIREAAFAIGAEYVNSDTTLWVIPPLGLSGEVEVSVESRAGTARAQELFRAFDGEPAIDSVEPLRLTSTTDVVLRGTNFNAQDPGDAILIGAAIATEFEVAAERLTVRMSDVPAFTDIGNGWRVLRYLHTPYVPTDLAETAIAVYVLQDPAFTSERSPIFANALHEVVVQGYDASLGLGLQGFGSNLFDVAGEIIDIDRAVANADGTTRVWLEIPDLPAGTYDIAFTTAAGRAESLFTIDGPGTLDDDVTLGGCLDLSPHRATPQTNRLRIIRNGTGQSFVAAALSSARSGNFVVHYSPERIGSNDNHNATATIAAWIDLDAVLGVVEPNVVAVYALLTASASAQDSRSITVAQVFSENSEALGTHVIVSNGQATTSKPLPNCNACVWDDVPFFFDARLEGSDGGHLWAGLYSGNMRDDVNSSLDPNGRAWIVHVPDADTFAATPDFDIVEVPYDADTDMTPSALALAFPGAGVDGSVGSVAIGIRSPTSAVIVKQINPDGSFTGSEFVHNLSGTPFMVVAHDLDSYWTVAATSPPSLLRLACCDGTPEVDFTFDVPSGPTPTNIFDSDPQLLAVNDQIWIHGFSSSSLLRLDPYVSGGDPLWMPLEFGNPPRFLTYANSLAGVLQPPEGADWALRVQRLITRVPANLSSFAPSLAIPGAQREFAMAFADNERLRVFSAEPVVANLDSGLVKPWTLGVAVVDAVAIGEIFFVASFAAEDHDTGFAPVGGITGALWTGGLGSNAASYLGRVASHGPAAWPVATTFGRGRPQEGDVFLVEYSDDDVVTLRVERESDRAILGTVSAPAGVSFSVEEIMMGALRAEVFVTQPKPRTDAPMSSQQSVSAFLTLESDTWAGVYRFKRPDSLEFASPLTLSAADSELDLSGLNVLDIDLDPGLLASRWYILTEDDLRVAPGPTFEELDPVVPTSLPRSRCDIGGNADDEDEMPLIDLVAIQGGFLLGVGNSGPVQVVCRYDMLEATTSAETTLGLVFSTNDCRGGVAGIDPLLVPPGETEVWTRNLETAIGGRSRFAGACRYDLSSGSLAETVDLAAGAGRGWRFSPKGDRLWVVTTRVADSQGNSDWQTPEQFVTTPTQLCWYE